MGVKDEIITEVVQKLRSGGKVPQPIIESFAEMLRRGPVTKDSLSALVREDLENVDKDKEATD